MKYLGHIISAEGVATDPEKVSVVAQWRRPSNVTELRSFLGFASYYCRFVEGFASVAAPLHKLVGAVQGGKKPVHRTLGSFEQHWTNNCERTFVTLNLLTSTPHIGNHS